MATEQKYIFICTGKSCKKHGSKKLLKELKSLKKEKGIRVIKTKCMDYCKKGPNVVIDNRLYHFAGLDDILSAIKE